MQNGQPPERPAQDPAPAPPTAAPTTQAPAAAPAAPPAAPAAAPLMPDVPAPPAHPTPLRLDLRVSKRILWIGAAVYPLANIARVYSFVMRPKRKEAVMRFLRYTAATLVVGFIAMLPSLPSLAFGGGGEQNSGAAGYVTFIWIVAVVAEIYFFIDMLGVLTAPPQHVLAVETSGASTALVTSQDPRQLDQIVGQISYAIDHPEAEFKVTVESLTVSPKNYYFGDNVNMYGGSGNVGIGA
ncbi:hypothetical protein FB563_2247 [Streptomyces puniciscabiei]|uniref:Uncharacterized protein n=1 Tax=Streptomyces puniciscabiei TaxID=164348 RepID=A0A542UDX5_9ACTN|nr:DUF6232 family protein [Streptomyces puniciscabiei]TQK97284.1 hypothetical protein FB563_2247 [Streptomyces puniciscabiei]